MRSHETVEDACSIATDVLAGSLDAHAGCALIASIGAKLNYPPALESFAAIAHDQDGHEAFGITAESGIDEMGSDAPGFLAFAGNGGGEVLAFNAAGAVYMIPLKQSMRSKLPIHSLSSLKRSNWIE